MKRGLILSNAGRCWTRSRKGLLVACIKYTAQCVNYLKATGLQVCLLVNFGASKATIKRIVYEF
ncbi:MAG: hypothetical protein OER43_00080 [Gammaproteobacteria bacterium]|nr:hypothetical protein [Gammaproteobacteria bacterium]MDH3412100.1 hypothetical protein [Gammaproteobacteria bacterium]